MSSEISPAVQSALILEELRMWKNTQWIATIKHRVNKRIGNEEANVEVEKLLSQCEIAIEELNTVLSEISAPKADAT